MSIPETTDAQGALCMSSSASTSQPTRWRLSPPFAFVGAIVAFVGVAFAAGAPSPLFVLFQQQWHFQAWVLTVAFAIYAITLLATLLVAGSLSDYIGRRPVLIGALATEAIAMALFVVAPNIGWIIVARAIQGIATGAATSTFTAAIVELAPERHKKLGSLIGSTAPVGGIALGALITGVVIQFTHSPSVIIFSFLTLLFILGALVIYFSAETVSPRDGAINSLIPRLSVPRPALREFAASVPVLVATWMFAGLFLGLAPSIIRGIFHIESGLVNGVLVSLPAIVGASASLIFGRFSARITILVGGSTALVGILIVVIGIAAVWFPFLFIGGVIGGIGFGTAFSGAIRAVAPFAQAHQRAELFAALYLVSYLAYGAPALIAGEMIGIVGLLRTVIGYGVVAIIAAAIGIAAQLRLARASN